ncbi:hypothetical protein N7466_000942 [Penicillium verhagenii]|uniref:uncharacterized protein n=1 Tax=Penicillium verhagenii TaxID=1562060 RepID=UPI0025458F42|nr:uncharacterized protein N7466_000942 [Penicillium verhagenii]KAJ5947927.1 hypothetical protein N7466_000942 [Penicillium verhagenii]
MPVDPIAKPRLPALTSKPSPSFTTRLRRGYALPSPCTQHTEMPARLRSTLQRSIARPLDSAGVIYCQSCSTWRRTLSTRATSSIDKIAPARRSDRLASPVATSFTRSIITSTAISTVPSRFKELHDALSGIKDATIEQVSVSRLQLALRGLESEEPLIRIAVLGLDNVDSARKLVRLLLADPLGPREDWEDILETYDSDASQGLLIRYGEISESIPNDLFPTIAVRSSILKKGNLEILISAIGSGSNSTRTTLDADTFLVPTVTIETPHPGRNNIVRYPVHRSIVCGSGVDGLLAFSSLMGQSDLKNEVESVRGAIELSVDNEKSGNSRLSFVDIERASKALDRIRESVQNATEYERGWTGSGVQPTIDWLASTSQVVKEDTLNPALVPLIESILDAADEGVLARDAKALEGQAVGVPQENVRFELERGVVRWAERAHSELRSSLEAGFASPRWRGLAWWKLFWRVDDVGMITSEILEKRFLRRAEREAIWSSGQYQQAGLLDDPEPATSPEPNPDSPAAQSTPIPPPWPTHIPDMRTKLLTTTVPSLQALAQSLVLFSISTTTLTSALSALTYLSIPTASVYESCTLGAVGLIYSLRRQQKKWVAAREFWEEEVREEGRASLRETEDLMRGIVRDGGKDIEDLTDHRAREAVDRARKALAEIKA